MEQYSIIVEEHVIDERLQGFDLMQKQSSQIDYYGVKGNNVFVQFKNGTGYIYEDVPKETIDRMLEAESIGSFVFKNLRGLPFKKYELKLVSSKPQ